MIYSPSVYGQTPTVADIYKMVLELKADQAKLRAENEKATQEAAAAKQAYQEELAETAHYARETSKCGKAA